MIDKNKNDVYKVYMGIDYSMTSPAVCLWDSLDKFSFKNCKLFSLTNYKKSVGKYSNNITVTFNNFLKDDNEKRFDNISGWISDLIDCYHVTNVYIEGYSMASRGMVFNIGENTGVLKHKLYKKDIPIIPLSPKSVKKFATENGNANKEKMNESFIIETKIDIKTLTGQTEKQWNPSSDLIDAFYILKYGLSGDNVI